MNSVYYILYVGSIIKNYLSFLVRRTRETIKRNKNGHPTIMMNNPVENDMKNVFLK